MKKTVIAMILTISMNAQAANFQDILFDYILPCAATFGVGALLSSEVDDAVALGSVGCVAAGSATFVQQRKKMSVAAEMNKGMSPAEADRIQKMIEDGLRSQENKFNARINVVEKSVETKVSSLQDLIKTAISEQLLKLDQEMRVYLKKELENGNLMPEIQANIQRALRSEVMTTLEEYNKDMVKKCVEATIKEVIARPIGVSTPNSTAPQQ